MQDNQSVTFERFGRMVARAFALGLKRKPRVIKTAHMVGERGLTNILSVDLGEVLTLDLAKQTGDILAVAANQSRVKSVAYMPRVSPMIADGRHFTYRQIPVRVLRQPRYTLHGVEHLVRVDVLVQEGAS